MHFDHQLLKDLKAAEKALEMERRYEKDAKLFHDAQRIIEAEKRAKKDADIVSGSLFQAQLASDRALAGIHWFDFAALQKHKEDQDRLEAYQKLMPSQGLIDAITGANVTPKYVDVTMPHVVSQKKDIAMLVEKEVKRQLQQRDEDAKKSNDD